MEDAWNQKASLLYGFFMCVCVCVWEWVRGEGCTTCGQHICGSLSRQIFNCRFFLKLACQFHQRFTYKFFVRTPFSLVTFCLVPKICTKNAHKKRWSNWHLAMHGNKNLTFSLGSVILFLSNVILKQQICPKICKKGFA